MYWIMFTERKGPEEKRLSGIPSLIDKFNLECNKGEEIDGVYPTIEFTPDEEFIAYTDNIVAPGFAGLLSNKRVSDTLKSLDIHNFQQFSVLLKGITEGQDCPDYDLINIIGNYDIIDYEKSDVILRRPGKIKFIESLSFINTDKMDLPRIFRLTSFLPLVIAHDSVKKAFEGKGITGFTFYKPEDFYL
ncbi:imm11 family protein [Shewanella woodyi]|uniref:imm11 family protein n=1 Tax=Shewanella woodyi TaxID=60961 RepID=UPI0007E9C7A2|nr:DUF1629 domain-containing protein [Shewanella woodyi]